MSRDMKNKFGVAYTPSNDTVRVTIPDTVRFPHTSVYAYMHDKTTVVLAPTPPPDHKRDSFRVPLNRHPAMPGCRSAVFGPVPKLCEPFRMTDTIYKVVGDCLHIYFPEHRLPPMRRGKRDRSAAPAVRAAPVPSDTFLVLIEQGSNTVAFRVPDTELHPIIVKWLMSGYGQSS